MYYASGMMGPNVTQALINKHGNNWIGFPLLFALSFAGGIIVTFFVDIEGGKRQGKTDFYYTQTLTPLIWVCTSGRMGRVPGSGKRN